MDTRFCSGFLKQEDQLYVYESASLGSLILGRCLLAVADSGSILRCQSTSLIIWAKSAFHANCMAAVAGLQVKI